ncbi:TolB family protein [Echinimonas agarilytica]|uniref:WD40-like Beta Propeller Repeat n=1 Tax=Echinimonas agarilytica TaxID=1215918 RepID=A0AA41W5A4_9GAMM|nr:hypothetical protein [Echinimonas agarilytica]MCM2679204.1 hypothetical protein [Echinimonas agarilytica]
MFRNNLRLPLKLIALGISSSLMMNASYAEIIFNAKVMGPVTNIYSMKESGELKALTQNKYWRDVQQDVSQTGQVIFVSNRQDELKPDIHRTSESLHLYLRQSATGHVEQITDGSFNSVEPLFSPNGQYVVYKRVAKGKPNELVVKSLSPVNSSQVLLLASQVTGFSWSPSGDSIAVTYVESGISKLSLLGLTNQQETNLLRVQWSSKELESTSNKMDDVFSGQYVSPSFSPDGQYIAFIRHPNQQSSFRQLSVIHLETEKVVNMALPKAQVQAPIQWNDASDQLLYSALVNYRFRYDESKMDRVYEGAMEVFESNLKGQTKQLTNSGAMHFRPVYSPDERQIAYLFSDRLGDNRQFALRVMTLADAHEKELFNKVSVQSTLIWR